jgi:hypothetical protein
MEDIVAAPHVNSNYVPAPSSSPRLATNPKQIRGSFAEITTSTSGSNSLAVKDLMQSLQNDDDDDSHGDSVSRSGTQDEGDSAVDRRTRSFTTGSTDSACVQYYDDDAAAVAAKLRSQSTHSMDTPALSAERLAILQAAACNNHSNKDSCNEPQYLPPEEDREVTADSVATTVRRRGSSVTQMFTAITSSLSSSSADATPTISTQQQKPSQPPPPPPASTSPMTCSPKHKNPAAAAILAANNSDEETGKNQKRPLSSETTNPLRASNVNVVDSLTQSGSKGNNVVENPLAASRSFSAAKSIRTAPPPPSSPPLVIVSSKKHKGEES